jgi:hypothetical protein
MTYEVVLTKDAERDLEDIYRYIAERRPGRSERFGGAGCPRDINGPVPWSLRFV